MSNFKPKNKAIVMGLFETGLGVVRSLGQKGVKVTGVDFKKNIGFYSKYINNPQICPHPIEKEHFFIDFLIDKVGSQANKPVLFIDSDIFLNAISKNRYILREFFIFNLPEEELLNKITNKFEQYKLALEAGIDVPFTLLVNSSNDFNKFRELNFPLFIKATDVTIWRERISGSIKGFIVNNEKEFEKKVDFLLKKGVSFLIQEIIVGPDTNHFKYCAYFDKDSNPLAEFTLQKIRQNPIHFGVGAVVRSLKYPDLIMIGRKLFKNIKYKGIGSAEFKLDARDGKLKLIELNPRYWQQNYLATFCGINFPWINYLDLTSGYQGAMPEFIEGIKWINRYMDFDSFLKYHKEGVLTFSQWRKSLRGKKVYSDFLWNDPLPALYEIGFGKKLFKIPMFILKRIKSG